jgi:hypothetical protein
MRGFILRAPIPCRQKLQVDLMNMHCGLVSRTRPELLAELPEPKKSTLAKPEELAQMELKIQSLKKGALQINESYGRGVVNPHDRAALREEAHRERQDREVFRRETRRRPAGAPTHPGRRLSPRVSLANATGAVTILNRRLVGSRRTRSVFRANR